MAAKLWGKGSTTQEYYTQPQCCFNYKSNRKIPSNIKKTKRKTLRNAVATSLSWNKNRKQLTMTSRQLRDESKNSFRNGEAILKDWETLGLCE